MVDYIKSKFTFNCSNRGAHQITKPGLMSVTSTGNGILNISGDIGYKTLTTTPSNDWFGVNISGFEFSNYAFVPKDWNLNHWLHLGVNIVRIPIRWERVRPVLLGALDVTAVSELRAFIKRANVLGITAIIDVHNYGKSGATTSSQRLL